MPRNLLMNHDTEGCPDCGDKVTRSQKSYFTVERSTELPDQWVGTDLRLDLVTQGNSVEHALEMLSDARHAMAGGENKSALARLPPRRGRRSPSWVHYQKADGALRMLPGPGEGSNIAEAMVALAIDDAGRPWGLFRRLLYVQGTAKVPGIQEKELPYDWRLLPVRVSGSAEPEPAS